MLFDPNKYSHDIVIPEMLKNEITDVAEIDEEEHIADAEEEGLDYSSNDETDTKIEDLYDSEEEFVNTSSDDINNNILLLMLYSLLFMDVQSHVVVFFVDSVLVMCLIDVRLVRRMLNIFPLTVNLICLQR